MTTFRDAFYGLDEDQEEEAYERDRRARRKLFFGGVDLDSLAESDPRAIGAEWVGRLREEAR